MHSTRMLQSLLAVPLLSGAGLLAVGAPSGSTPPPSEHVSTTGTDTGTASAHRAPRSTTHSPRRHRARRSMSPPVPTTRRSTSRRRSTLSVRARPRRRRSTADGLDPYAMGDGLYGVVYVGNAGGQVTVNGFTITNPFPVQLHGWRARSRRVGRHQRQRQREHRQRHDHRRDGKDPDAGTDFPIGIDSFLNAATTTISGDTISGFFQGALLEDNGPATVSGDHFKKLISNTDTARPRRPFTPLRDSSSWPTRAVPTAARWPRATASPSTRVTGSPRMPGTRAATSPRGASPTDPSPRCSTTTPSR